MVKHVLPPIKVKKFEEIEIGKGFIARIKDRIERNRDYRAIFVGQTGSGKTYSAISLAWMIDPDIWIENIVFTPESFMQRILTASRNKKEWRGRPIILDEAGIVAPSQEWMTKVTRSLTLVSQTYRFLNLIVFYTAPSFGDIAAPQRRLFHSVFVTSPEVYNPKSIPKIYHYATLYAYDIAFDPAGFGSQQYKPILIKPRILNITDGRIAKLDCLYVHHPPKQLIKEYEKYKEDFMISYYEDQLEKIVAERGVDPGRYEQVKALIKKVISGLERFVSRGVGGNYVVSAKKISDILGVPYRTAKLIKEIVETEIEKSGKDLLEITSRRATGGLF